MSPAISLFQIIADWNNISGLCNKDLHPIRLFVFYYGHVLKNSRSRMSRVTNANNVEYRSSEKGAIFSSPLVEMSVVAVIIAIFFSARYWFLLFPLYLAIRIYSTDLGRRCLKSLPRDLGGLIMLLKLKWHMRRAFKKNKPIHENLLEFVNSQPDKECVVEVESGRFAWINNNLKLESLAHSITVSDCHCIVTSKALLPTLLKALDLPNTRRQPIFLVDGNTESEHEALNHFLADASISEPLPVEGLDFQSILCYIYTSGTTGNPKAAIIKHYRYALMSTATRCAFGICPTDRIYITMPMYHSAAGILGIGQVVITGITAVIRTKFSASNFWKDSIRFECTISQYIGEICRYLLAQKHSPEETQHQIRLMYGNGLRPEIWGKFVQRFNIELIGELYGSTEGNSNILNLDNHEGACGFMPIYPYINELYPIRLIKVDPETGEIVRNSDGLCVMCKPGDTGEMVGMIKDKDPLLRFEGYVNQEESKKKIIHDVTKKGDCVFTSGDILYWDKLGYLYFKDRRGDTYRWRGENVSTTEVEGVIQPIMSIVDATAYGVEIPGKEGRAGMLAVALADDIDLEETVRLISSRLRDNLASYAIPVFLRICNEVDKTGTHKLKKAALQKDGYELRNCGEDPLYFWDTKEKQYGQMTAAIQSDIDTGVYDRI
ncbi:AMP-binding enzyme domain-containing protein [Ditylenchus destructor]|uniref:Long-chain-fatty-acid--CoA ligase n=1 Tax=Ditylenchus destructor TaxID=166010 RepID=A0AAD4N607_9BILA|nr:AMP-binding enzyme domain-containing protein [Ditylenchus destructor]